MFRQRLLTTLILVPLVLIGLYYANLMVLAGVMLLIVMACGWEWLQLIPVQHLPAQIGLLVGLFMGFLLVHWIFYPWLLVGLGVWLLMIAAIITYPNSQWLWGHRVQVSILCLLFLPLFAQSVLGLAEMEGGKAYVLYLLGLVWAADIGAYLAGKSVGQDKLIPAVSPGKTIEGLLGGLILTMLVAVAGYWYFRPQVQWTWFLLAMLVFVMALFGDLFFSMLKRRCQIKDTGHWIPGHGGILDRLDSLIAAAPVLYIGLHGLILGTLSWH